MPPKLAAGWYNTNKAIVNPNSGLYQPLFWSVLPASMHQHKQLPPSSSRLRLAPLISSLASTALVGQPRGIDRADNGVDHPDWRQW
jgi:hypothetical protein